MTKLEKIVRVIETFDNDWHYDHDSAIPVIEIVRAIAERGDAEEEDKGPASYVPDVSSTWLTISHSEHSSIRGAIARDRRLRFTYKGDSMKRFVKPMELFLTKDGVWMIGGFDSARQSYRNFKLNEICNLCVSVGS